MKTFNWVIKFIPDKTINGCSVLSDPNVISVFHMKPLNFINVSVLCKYRTWDLLRNVWPMPVEPWTFPPCEWHLSPRILHPQSQTPHSLYLQNSNLHYLHTYLSTSIEYWSFLYCTLAKIHKEQFCCMYSIADCIILWLLNKCKTQQIYEKLGTV